MVQGMRASFSSFAMGLTLAVVLLFLILVAQFQSFLDPFIILVAVPPGLTGVILTLWLTDTTLNVMSLMGVVMLVGIAVSNSILIVEFTRHLRHEGMAVREAVAHGLPRAAAPGADDVARHHHRIAADGAETGRGQRIVRSAGARHSGRPGGVGGAHRIPGAGRVRAGLRPQKELDMPRINNALLVLATAAAICANAQNPPQANPAAGGGDRAAESSADPGRAARG